MKLGCHARTCEDKSGPVIDSIGYQVFFGQFHEDVSNIVLCILYQGHDEVASIIRICLTPARGFHVQNPP